MPANKSIKVGTARFLARGGEVLSGATALRRFLAVLSLFFEGMRLCLAHEYQRGDETGNECQGNQRTSKHLLPVAENEL